MCFSIQLLSRKYKHIIAPMVKWISRRSSEPLLGVRIPLGAQNGTFCRDSKTLSLLLQQYEKCTDHVMIEIPLGAHK